MTHSLLLNRGERMELLDTIKTLIKPILENNDVYLDDIEYLQENGEWYLRILLKKMKVP